VDHEGKIRLPTVGSLQVGGMELEDAEDAIRAAYVPKVFRDVAVHVGLMESDSTNVLVTGAVTAPGLVPLRRTERNLLFAIVGAGGVSEVASGEVTLRRLRPPGEVTTLPLTEPEGLKAALALDALEDGDIVTVHAATPNTIIVGGLVNAPRPQPYPPGVQMTVLQALAAAGGLRTDVTPREASLIRRMPDGQDVHVKLDLDRVTSGRDPNITLAGGDILWVPHTVETRVQDWINKNIFFRAGISTTATINYNAQAFEYLNTNAERRTGTGLGDGGTLQDAFDPYGFLLQNQALQQIPTTPSGP
jgi:protein involved in polysaccharide export with SLBB domain